MVRAAQRADYVKLLPLGTEIRRFHRRALPEIFQAKDRPLSRIKFQRHIWSQYTAFLVAVEGSEILGYAIARLEPASGLDRMAMRLTRLSAHTTSVPETDVPAPRSWSGRLKAKPRRTAFFDEAVVSPKARGLGVGVALADACMDWSRAQGACAVELQVYEFNQSAIEWYERLGFTTLRRRMRKPLAGPAGEELSGPSDDEHPGTH